MNRWTASLVGPLLALLAVLTMAQALRKPLVVETQDSHECPFSLQEHFKSASLVAKVAIDDARVVAFPDDVPTIVTDYTCRVLEVFHGEAAVGSQVTVRRDGGLREEPTRWRRLAVKGFPDFAKGEEYVLFLGASDSRDYFTVDRGGAFKLEEGVVRAFGTKPAARAVDAQPQSWFLERLREMRQ